MTDHLTVTIIHLEHQGIARVTIGTDHHDLPCRDRLDLPAIKDFVEEIKARVLDRAHDAGYREGRHDGYEEGEEAGKEERSRSVERIVADTTCDLEGMRKALKKLFAL